MKAKIERWADVPGYGGRYQASTHGNVRRVNDNGKCMMLKPFRREKQISCRMYRVRLSTPDGKRKELPLLNVIATTWRPPPPGMVVIHRNGMFSDNSVENIMFATKADVMRIYPLRHKNKVVCKVDKSGNVVEFYHSITEAAKKNYVSAGAVSKQCLRKVTNPLTTGNVIFKFDE